MLFTHMKKQQKAINVSSPRFTNVDVLKKTK